MTLLSRRDAIGTLGAGLLIATAGLDRSARAMTSPASRGHLFGEGPVGSLDDYRNGGPVVRWHPGMKRWAMWYYGRDSQFPKDLAPALGTGRIGLATSEDGLRWTRLAGPLSLGAVLEPQTDRGAFDCAHVSTGDVMFHDGRWWLWYFGGDFSTLANPPRGYDAAGYRMLPGLAQSPDGVHWARIAGRGPGGALINAAADEVYAAFPSATHDGKRFLLYWSALLQRVFYWRTRVAESTDGVTWHELGEWQWRNEPAGYEVGGSNTRHVIRNPSRKGPRWLMFYTALDARFTLYTRSIAVAGSDDGLVWEHLLDEPVLTIGPRDAWDGGGVSFPSVVARDGALWLYYYGFADRENKVGIQRGIGLAISEDGDLRKFRRVAERPPR